MPSFGKPRLLSESELNTIRGKSTVGHASVEEIEAVFGHLDCLETELDKLDHEEVFGPGGWRWRLGLPDAG